LRGICCQPVELPDPSLTHLVLKSWTCDSPTPHSMSYSSELEPRAKRVSARAVRSDSENALSGCLFQPKTCLRGIMLADNTASEIPAEHQPRVTVAHFRSRAEPLL